MIGRDYPQKATYWSTPQASGLGGYSYAAPDIINVRWEERQTEFTTPTGDLRQSRAVIFAETELELGAVLMLGEHTDVDPTALDDSWKIKQCITIPDLRNADNERRVFL